MRLHAFVSLLVFCVLVGCWTGPSSPAPQSARTNTAMNNKGENPPSVPVVAISPTPGQTAHGDAANQEKKQKFTFPYFLPDSRIVIGEELVDEVNALAGKDEQIQFLIQILPPSDQENKHLSDRQLYAIRLLSITESNAVIDPLMDRFDFVHKGDGWPVVHSMARLGERSVEPLLKRLQSFVSDRQKVAACGAALIEMKQKQFPMFIEELKKRQDLKLSDEVLNELLNQSRFAPD